MQYNTVQTYSSIPLAFKITRLSKCLSDKLFLFGALIIPAKENNLSTGAEDVKGQFSFKANLYNFGYLALKLSEVTVLSFI